MNRHKHNPMLTITRLLALVISLALCQTTVQAAADLSKEYSVKLAFLYKFANYVENGQGTNRDHITIGVLGDDPFGKNLDAVAERRKARGKTLRVVRFTTMDDYRACDILFVSRHVDPSQVQTVVERTHNDGVLVVGEQPQFTSHGGIMNFHIDADGKTGIELNVDAAQARNLRIDARLMRVCDIVQGGGSTP